MKRAELIRAVTDALKEHDVRKVTPPKKFKFCISDEDGNEKFFEVRKDGSEIRFTLSDVEAILDALIYVIEEALKRGEMISLRGIGTLYLKLRKGRRVLTPIYGEPIITKDTFIPQFSFGADIRKCAKIYTLSCEEKASGSDIAKQMKGIDENAD